MVVKNIIRLDGVTKKYRTGKVTVTAVRDISLIVGRGEFLLLKGPSGSGKSTLLNIMGCLTRITSGRYLLDGQEISHWPDHFLSRLRGKRFGFVFQQFNLITGLSVLENIVLPMIPLGIPRNVREKRGYSILESLFMETRAHFPAQELSGGQQQLVAIARALVNEPDIILADEPFSNIDIRYTENLSNLLAELKSRGKTIIVTANTPSPVEGLADRCFDFFNPHEA